MNIGIIAILISACGYISNWLNWKYLNYRLTRYLYYIGALVHESSHALLCLATGAKIEKMEVFSTQPHVIYRKSKLPILGDLFISFAPIIGGIIFIFIVNHFLLGDYFVVPIIATWQDFLLEPLRLIIQANPIHWQSWVMIALFINVGAMLGPSLQDMKNIWPILIVLLFLQNGIVSQYGLLALSFILVNIIVQMIIICGIFAVRAYKTHGNVHRKY